MSDKKLEGKLMTDDQLLQIIVKCNDIIEENESDGVDDLSVVSVMLAVAIKKMKQYISEEELEEILHLIATGEIEKLIKNIDIKKETIH